MMMIGWEGGIRMKLQLIVLIYYISTVLPY